MKPHFTRTLQLRIVFNSSKLQHFFLCSIMVALQNLGIMMVRNFVLLNPIHFFSVFACVYLQSSFLEYLCQFSSQTIKVWTEHFDTIQWPTSSSAATVRRGRRLCSWVVANVAKLNHTPAVECALLLLKLRLSPRESSRVLFKEVVALPYRRPRNRIRSCRIFETIFSLFFFIKTFKQNY